MRSLLFGITWETEFIWCSWCMMKQMPITSPAGFVFTLTLPACLWCWGWSSSSAHWQLGAPPPALLSESPPIQSYCSMWSEACKMGLSVHHPWTPHPLKNSNPKGKPPHSQAPWLFSPHCYLWLLQPNEFQAIFSISKSHPLHIQEWSQNNFASWVKCTET